MCPDSGRYSRDTQLSSVDLPAPFGPIRPTISPSSTLNETSANARRPENASETLAISRRVMDPPAQGAPCEIHEANQSAGNKLHTEDEHHAVDHHLCILELAQDFRREREIGAAQQGAAARVQASDHRHGKKRERHCKREGFGAEMPEQMAKERARNAGKESAHGESNDD